jgi:hypothetical protein
VDAIINHRKITKAANNGHSVAHGTPDGRIGDAMNVIAHDLVVALGTALAETLASFSAASHLGGYLVGDDERMSVVSFEGVGCVLGE